MKRFYIFKDGTMQGSAATRESALNVIRQFQKEKTHLFLKSEYSLIEGVEEFIPYERTAKPPKRKSEKER